MASEEHDHCDTNIDYQEAITNMRTKDGLMFYLIILILLTIVEALKIREN